MHPRNISIADYRYELPQEKIAHHPLPERDGSKLLIYRDGQISEDIYRNIAASIPEDSLLVFNNTKVVEARIIFTKSSGGKIEVFCLEPPPGHGGVGQAMMQTGKVLWKCLIGGASKWKPGQVLVKSIETAETPATGHSEVRSIASPHQSPTVSFDSGNDSLVLEARYIDKSEGAFLIEFSWNVPDMSFAELLHRAGLIPLPPYIRRTPDASDSARYQTVYAEHDGSVAAPTAGLHFTDNIFSSLAAKNINREFVTLHVGAGTFLPVKSETMEGHNMHVEYISVTRRGIENILEMLSARATRATTQTASITNPAITSSSIIDPSISSPSITSPSIISPSATENPTSQPLIIPVGTTSARTLESLYWLGLRTILDPSVTIDGLIVSQWDAYDLPSEAGTAEALHSLLQWLDRNDLTELITRTQLLITPGYRWRVADALVTNFHQPESTLLLLVASLIGPGWKKVYDYALTHEFRFLSYGDGSLLFPPKKERAR